MPNYRRLWHPGGTYFFTVTLLQRRNNDLLTREIDLLRTVVADVRRRHPFRIHGWVVLPDHLHCVIELPEGDVDFPVRWRLIKMGFSKGIPATERRSAVRQRRGERGIWQRRFWEHLIRDEDDFQAHMDYVHFNPAKHGLVTRVMGWPYSTFHRLVEQGVYSADWGGSVENSKLSTTTEALSPSDTHAAQCPSVIAPYEVWSTPSAACSTRASRPCAAGCWSRPESRLFSLRVRLFCLRESKKAFPLIKFSSTESEKAIPLQRFCFPEGLFRFSECGLAIPEGLFCFPEWLFAVSEWLFFFRE